MNNIIQSIYYSRHTPYETAAEKSTDYKTALSRLEEAIQRLKQILPADDLQTLDTLLDAQTEINYLLTEQEFAEGFKLGAQTMIEVLEK